jgi:cellulose synthase/poly-beta-1,6-N-acetylglucosamine synthase-like glycosyltransferase
MKPHKSVSHHQLAVFIASKGRADHLKETLESVRKQSVPPAQIILSVTDEMDLPQGVTMETGVSICIGPAGKTRQQNLGLKHLDPSITVIAFLDDDVELSQDYLKAVRHAFDLDEQLVGISGHVLVNGGISRDEARSLIAQIDEKAFTENSLSSGLLYNASNQGLYGCCMSLRRSVFDHIQFDERLELYSWLEDADIGIRAQRYGRCGYSPDAQLIHLSVQTGRVAGLRFGFSQIMNPVHLATNGVMLWKDVFRIHILKVLSANLLGLAKMDRQIDRWGRLRGNLLALWFWATGRIEPEKIRFL